MKKLIYVLYALLFLAATGFLIYDILVAKNFDSNSITKYLILVAGFVLSIVKLSVRPQREVLRKKQVYQNAYAEFIRNAFSNDKKMESQLYSAIHDYNQQKPDLAIKKLENLRKECQNSDDLYAVTCFMALCLDDLGAYEAAADCYKAGLNLRPNSTLASNLGICLERLGNQQEAIGAYHYASEIDPKNAYPHNNLAQLYIRTGEYESAIESAKAAVTLNSKMYQSYSAMAISYAMLGNKEAYETNYRLAVANGSDGRKIKAFIEALDSSLD
jgi:tetratricopeptide (TPR) repeat protein